MQHNTKWRIMGIYIYFKVFWWQSLVISYLLDFTCVIALAYLALAQRGCTEKTSDDSLAQSWQMADLLKTVLAVILFVPTSRRKKFIQKFSWHVMWKVTTPEAMQTLYPLQPAGLSHLVSNCSACLFHLRWHDPKKTALGRTLWLKCTFVVVHPCNLCFGQ